MNMSYDLVKIIKDTFDLDDEKAIAFAEALVLERKNAAHCCEQDDLTLDDMAARRQAEQEAFQPRYWLPSVIVMFVTFIIFFSGGLIGAGITLAILR